MSDPVKKADVLIVGAGHGGAQCAITLRQSGFTGSVVIIGREPEPPYERPPLSKEYLAREKTFDRLHIRPLKFWKEKDIELRLGLEVTAVDPVARSITLSDGRACGYGTLIWAAGGDARQLSCPGGDLAGVHSIRTKADCDQLMEEIDGSVRNVVVVGGGYIGLEAAAVLTKLGCAITLLEALPRVLARVAGPELSAFYESEHRRHGVDLRTNVQIEALEGEGRVTGVRLVDGSVIPADAVIAGIGIVPAVEPLLAAGAKGANGVEVDALCRTTLPDVYAIGDCATFKCAYAEMAPIRVESVQNAHDQASCVAKAICGAETPYRALPWFWSNQFDLKLQTVGLSIGYDQTVLRGHPEDRAFSIIYLKQGRVIALDCVNMVRDYVQGRKLVETGIKPDVSVLADADVQLKDLIAR